MNIKNLNGVIEFGTGASEYELQGLERQLEEKIPCEYKFLLSQSNGVWHKNGLVIYAIEDVFERNETMGAIKYAAGYLAIGDDSGGRAILVPYEGTGVYIVDQGSMDPDDFDRVGASLTDWVNNGCVLP
ncbi:MULTISPECIES: SMI1/KNR4 family protein [Pseudomonas]|uniref:SMI1/KNR4 family protein n=1 Tax=Pseudomonas yamanorum TaxID=515393 RepID=A0A7Y8ECZ6_9PSED|nr:MULTISPECIES: SMI1/KNR4 family protein [Pseudomonas]MBT1266028.1 SMI1/KNR4 family protein [Pseudomonas sp. VS38]NWE12396.1 SMI1/KNR4 family protein [Pseudomonas yamanorum]